MGRSLGAPGRVGCWPEGEGPELALGCQITDAQPRGSLGPKYTLHNTPPEEGDRKEG